MTSSYNVPDITEKMRIDTWLHSQHPDVSRSRWKSLVKNGHALLNGAVCKPSHLLHGGEKIDVEIPPPKETSMLPEDIPLDILYEDEYLLAINKRPGLVVHPAPGHPSGTLANAVLYHCGDLAGIGGELRPGIVHRLDKDTSGIIVVAKTEQAMAGLSAQFKNRTTRKEYEAVVRGIPSPRSGTVETEIGRSLHDRKKMSVNPPSGHHAVTHYETVELFSDAARMSVVIKTGRTHQIRVHMAHIQHPVLGDKIYGGKRSQIKDLPALRQMLHARYLVVTHPVSGETIELTAPLPEDMRNFIEKLRCAN
jgi:23S rRNA pseudouridine1911/1915/1917 synthase